MEKEFIERALNDFAGIWSEFNLNQLSAFEAPHNILGRRRHLLKGDINEQWARWFTESLVDPRIIAENKLTYPFIFEKVLKSVEEKFNGEKTRPEKQQIASVTAKIIQSLSNSIVENRKRSSISFDDRKLMLDLAGSIPRCWICGAAFIEQAIDNFIYGYCKEQINLPPFVDLLKPRGLVQRDLAIEIDHIVPFSKGGREGENLRLACGWCNSHKSSYMSIYDVEGQPRSAGSNSMGISSLPHPFWTVRLLALVRKCEHHDGCDYSVGNAEVTVVPIQKDGAMNPTNLRVTCYEHDPFVNYRLQPPSIVKKIWNI